MNTIRSSRFLFVVVMIALIIAGALAQSMLHPTVSADSDVVVVASSTPMPCGVGEECREGMGGGMTLPEERDATTHSDANAPIEGTIERPEACRTYALWGHMGGVDAVNGIPCGGKPSILATITKTVRDIVATLTATPVVPVTATPTISTTSTPAPTQETPVVPTLTATPAPTQTAVPTQVFTSTPEPTQAPACEDGNPGNLKCVGKSLEDPNGRGTMPQDNTGGNGNGQHGNQGTGGSGNGNGNGG